MNDGEKSKANSSRGRYTDEIRIEKEGNRKERKEERERERERAEGADLDLVKFQRVPGGMLENGG